MQPSAGEPRSHIVSRERGAGDQSARERQSHQRAASAGEPYGQAVSRERGAGNQSARVRQSHQCAAERRRATQPRLEGREALAISQHVRQSHQRAAERSRATQPRLEGKEALAISQHVRQSHQRAAERSRATQPRLEGREALAIGSAREAKSSAGSPVQASHAATPWGEREALAISQHVQAKTNQSSQEAGQVKGQVKTR